MPIDFKLENLIDFNDQINPQISAKFDPLEGVRAVYGDRFSKTYFTFPANKDLRDRAKEIASKMTKAEKLIWFNLLKSNKTGFKFVKQKIIDNYIVDFYCHSLGLVIEVYGDTHAERKEYDEVRTKLLNYYGLKFIRYANKEICDNLDEVFEDLKNQIQKRQKEILN